MSRPKHPNKHIEESIQYAEEHGWRYKKTGKSAHAWGRLLCVLSNRSGCSMSIWSTPRNPLNHANQIIRKVNQCIHDGDDDE